MTKKIFEPIEINGMMLKNRLGFPPFLNMPANDDCTITDQTVRWFEDRAKGGAALVMTGAVLAGPEPDFEMLKALDMTRVGKTRGTLLYCFLFSLQDKFGMSPYFTSKSVRFNRQLIGTNGW